MRRYIDVDELIRRTAPMIETINQQHKSSVQTWQTGYNEGIVAVQNIAQNLPTFNVRETNHAEWVRVVDEPDGFSSLPYVRWKCSRCGYQAKSGEDSFAKPVKKPKDRYCKDCGAYMVDGEQDE